jgi:hypothetical protein
MARKATVLPNTAHNRADRRVTTSGKRATVKIPNASHTGYDKWEASPGDMITFTVDAAPGYSDKRNGRVVGRVDASGASGADKTPIVGWICVAMLSDDLSFAYEMWVDPANVTSCRAAANDVEFWRTFMTADPGDLLRMSEYGSLGASPGRSNALPPARSESGD